MNRPVLIRGPLSLFIAFFFTSFSFSAFAALGDRESSIAIDQKMLKASSARSTQKASYTVHEMSSNGSLIRQYVSADGIVFAVTWQGMKRPDLSVLLGNYFTEYTDQNALRVKGVGRQPVEVKSANVVVRHSGHMRNLTGRAFLPDLVPVDVNVGSLP